MVPFCPPSRKIIPVSVKRILLKSKLEMCNSGSITIIDHYFLSHYFIVGTMAAVGIVMPIVGGALGGLFSYFFFK